MGTAGSAVATGNAFPKQFGPLGPGTPFELLRDRPLNVKVFRPGSWIMMQGDAADCLYIVQEGQVALTRLSPQGRETTIGFALPGDFFGEVGLLDGGEVPYNALAVERTVLLAVRADQFRVLLNDPRSCRALLETVSRRCRDAWSHIEVLGGGALRDKIREMLPRLCSSIGVETSDGVEIQVGQGELAKMLGSSRESLNRQLRSLREDGTLQVRVRNRRTTLILRRTDF